MQSPLARLVTPQPASPDLRLALFTVRRMGAHGLADAHAAWATLSAFGRGFRRPLLLTRALLAELSATARGTIAIAPCCCPRMTGAERALLDLLAAAHQPDRARPLAQALLGAEAVDHVVAAAAAVSRAYAEAGRPLSA